MRDEKKETICQEQWNLVVWDLMRADSKEQPVVVFRLKDSFVRFINRIQLKRGRIPVVHAYTGYGSTKVVRVLGRVFLQKRYDNPLSIYRGIRALTALAVVPNVELNVIVDGKEIGRTIRTNSSGYIDANFRLRLKPGEHQICFRIIDNLYYKAQVQTELSTGKLLIYKSSQSVGVICDFDDTVIKSNLSGWVRAVWLALFTNPRKRKPIPGMNRFFSTIHKIYPHAFFIYVSTTAWNMSYYLKRFLAANDFPFGPMILRDWGPEEDKTFHSGVEHKLDSIKGLFQRFPESKWILIGDNGQKDPQIYGDIIENYPKKVLAVAIRELIKRPRQTSLEQWGQDNLVIYGNNGYDLYQNLLSRVDFAKKSR